MPKVSIIIPAYNAENYIQKCLDSISLQTFSDFEVIVVDDGSTDNTSDIVKAYIGNDARFSLLQQENLYAGIARNNGMKHAQGEYFLFFDADDFMESTLLEEMVTRADETSADVVVCRSHQLDCQTDEITPLNHALTVEDTSRVYSSSDLSSCIFNSFVGWPWDKLFKKSFIESHGLLFQDTRTTNDAFFVFIALVSADRIALVDKFLIYHRVKNSSSLENTRSKSWSNTFAACNAIEKRLVNDGVFPNFEQSFLNWVLDLYIWNLFTLTDEASDAFMDSIKADLLPRLQSKDPSYFYNNAHYQLIHLIALRRSDLLKYTSDRLWEIRDIKKELERVEEERDRYIAELDRVVNSTSFKVGTTLTSIPRKMKSSLSKK